MLNARYHGYLVRIIGVDESTKNDLNRIVVIERHPEQKEWPWLLEKFTALERSLEIVDFDMEKRKEEYRKRFAGRVSEHFIGKLAQRDRIAYDIRKSRDPRVIEHLNVTLRVLEETLVPFSNDA